MTVDEFNRKLTEITTAKIPNGFTKFQDMSKINIKLELLQAQLKIMLRDAVKDFRERKIVRPPRKNIIPF